MIRKLYQYKNEPACLSVCLTQKMPKPNNPTKEQLKPCTIFLEDEQVEALDELAKEYTKVLGQKWTRSAVVRLAVGDFLTKMKKIL